MKRHVLFAVFVAALYFIFAAAVSFAQAVVEDVTGSPAVAVGDPVQWVLQGGGFALAVYIVRWLTTTMSSTLTVVGVNMQENTNALKALQEIVRETRLK